MRRALAGAALGVALSLGPVVEPVFAQDTDTEEDDDNANWGLLGLIGLGGLAGLAGLKRRQEPGYRPATTGAISPNIHGATGRNVDTEP